MEGITQSIGALIIMDTRALHKIFLAMALLALLALPAPAEAAARAHRTAQAEIPAQTRDAAQAEAHAQVTGDNVVIGALVYNVEGIEFGAWGNLRTASRKFEEALRYMPHYARAELNLKICEDALNGLFDREIAVSLFSALNTPLSVDREGALALVNETIEAVPDYYPAYIVRARLSQKLGEKERARADLDKAVAMAPRAELPWYFRGKFFGENGLFVAAVADFSALLALDSAHTTALIERGNALCGIDEYDRAIGDFERVFRLWPRWEGNFNVFKAYLNRGIGFIQEGRYYLALPDLSRAIDLNTRFTEPYLNRGIAYYHTRSFEHALSDFNTVLDREPGRADATFHRGLTFYKTREIDAAIEDLQRTIELDPDHLHAHTTLGEIYVKTHSFEEGVRLFDKVLEIDPGYFWAHYWSALALDKLKRYKDALRAYNSFLADVPLNYRDHRDFAERRVRNLEKWARRN